MTSEAAFSRTECKDLTGWNPDLAKQKETEMANKEMNSEVFSVVILKYVYMSLCMCIF